jgi:hypothetical protein
MRQLVPIALVLLGCTTRGSIGRVPGGSSADIPPATPHGDSPQGSAGHAVDSIAGDMVDPAWPNLTVDGGHLFWTAAWTPDSKRIGLLRRYQIGGGTAESLCPDVEIGGTVSLLGNTIYNKDSYGNLRRGNLGDCGSFTYLFRKSGLTIDWAFVRAVTDGTALYWIDGQVVKAALDGSSRQVLDDGYNDNGIVASPAGVFWPRSTSSRDDANRRCTLRWLKPGAATPVDLYDVGDCHLGKLLLADADAVYLERTEPPSITRVPVDGSSATELGSLGGLAALDGEHLYLLPLREGSPSDIDSEHTEQLRYDLVAVPKSGGNATTWATGFAGFVFSAAADAHYVYVGGYRGVYRVAKDAIIITK